MKKTLSMILSFLLIAGTAVCVSANGGDATSVDSGAAASDLYNFCGEIVYTCVEAERIDANSIVGEVIGGGDITEGNYFEFAFDGDLGTFYNGVGAVYDMWVGLVTEKPAVVKSFSVATQDNDGDGVSDRRHAIWGSRLQGSDDGIVWEDIYVYEYTDFEDYANDTESTWLTIELPDNEEAYTFFRMINNDDGANALAELRLFTAAKEAVVYPAYPAYDYLIYSDEYPGTNVAFGEGYPGSTAAGIPACTTGTILKGTVATSVNSSGIFAWNGLDSRYNPEHAFDGNNLTFFYAFNQSAMYHPILLLDQAYELTEIRLFTYPSAAVPTTDHLIQGSNDGENWVTIVHLPTIETDSYVIFTPEANSYEGFIDYSDCWVGGGSYSLYRYINSNGTTYNGVSDIEFYGVPAEATVVTPDMIVEPDLSVNHYPGIVDVTDKQAASVDGSLAGTIIGGGGGWNGHNYDHAFDGKTNTYFDPNYSSPICWVGIKVEAPTVLTGAKIYPVYQTSELGRLRRIEGGLIQGSNDGENWTTIFAYTPDDIPKTGKWIEKTFDSAEAYTYFRYVNNGYGHGEAAEILFFGEEPPAPVEFDLVDTLAQAGGSVEVTINAAATVPANSFALYELTYDPAVLTFVEFTGFGEIVTDSFFGTEAVDNELKTVLFAFENAATFEGLVAKIKFTVNADAAEGTTEVTMKALVKNDSEVIEAAVDGAVIEVKAAGTYVPGDIDGNGALDLQDALNLFQYSMMPDIYELTYAGNIDYVADGNIDIRDALYLFQSSMMPDIYPIY